MHFFLIAGHGGKASVLSVVVNRSTQQELTHLFNRLADDVVAADSVAFDPGYRADDDEVVTIAPYDLPSSLAVLETLTVASNLPQASTTDLAEAPLRGLAAVEWAGDAPRRIAFQRLDARYVLKAEGRRLFLSEGRFVKDERPGFEITERVDAVLENGALYVTSWRRAHAVLDLSAWVKQATLAETEAFLGQRQFKLAEGFAVDKLADAWVRRKITSIAASGLLTKAKPAVLSQYAADFGVELELKAGKIVLPADKKAFKAVLSLLDQDLLSFEPTSERWIVNSKRKPG